jgi:hypothetical protein
VPPILSLGASDTKATLLRLSTFRATRPSFLFDAKRTALLCRRLRPRRQSGQDRSPVVGGDLRFDRGAITRATPNAKGGMTARTFLFTSALTAASAGAALTQDVSKGEASFKKCLAGHAIGDKAQNKIGPELNGFDVGSVADFIYSSANRGAGIIAEAAAWGMQA